MRALAFLGYALAAFAASAQDAPPRQIAPDLFHPYSQGEFSARQPPSAIVAPTLDRPLGACNPKAHDWIPCLTATAAQSEAILDDAEQSVRAALMLRRDLNPYLRKSDGEALARIDEEWRRFRDRECDALALLERGLPPQAYEARLTCRILRNLERAETLKARYRGG